MQEPTEKSIEEIKVVGPTIKTTMKNAPKDCPAVWENFMKRMPEIKNIKDDKKYYGPTKDIPEEGFDFESMAGVEVESLDNIPEGMKGWTIPKGTYLVFTHKGNVNKIGELWGYIYCEYKGDFNKKGMAFEYYDEQCIPDSDDSVAYIYVPKN